MFKYIIALCFIIPFSVNAHNVWIKRTTNLQYVVKFGHNQTEPYTAKKLQAVKGLSASGQIFDLPYHFSKKSGEAYFNARGSSIIYLRFDNGIWSKLPNGEYVEKSKKEAPTAEFSINPIKLGKAILKWDEQATKSHAMEYELIPQTKPENNKPLAILVLKNGNPVQGIKVGLGEDHPFNLTNEQGIAIFKPRKGFNKVWAMFEEKVENNPDYTDRSYEYMLTFDVK